jgi:error-prone DNA polymerase
VESARREEVYERILRRYGDDRCACVTMVDTYRARAAVREVGKALGYPEAEIDLVAKAFPHIGANRIRDAIQSLPELRGSNLQAGQLEILFRVAERLNGFPRHLALHPSGIVLSDHDLPDRVPMERSFLEHRMVQADKDDVERLGLLKLDVLGVRMLSSMRHALDEIERTTGAVVDLDRVPKHDPATWDLIRSSRTVGCFQIESPGQRELLQKFQPERFEDLIIDISLFRPGPVKSDMVTPFLRRRLGFELPVYAHPRLRAVLRETHGVIVYHEQLMQVIAEVGGYDLSEADRIRRHLDDDPEDVADFRAELYARARSRGWDRGNLDRVWKECFAFASFGFCKAHAASFAVPTYQSAWLKANYPAHFLAGVLTHEPGMYPRRLILEDARQSGVAVLPLDVNASLKTYTVEELDRSASLICSGSAARSSSEGERRVAPRPPAAPLPPLLGLPRDASPSRDSLRDRSLSNTRYGIRLALQDVHGISDDEIRRILEAREAKPFVSVVDFVRRTNVSRPVVEALAHAGAFDSLASNATRPRRWTRRDRLYVAMTTDAEPEGEQLALPLSGEPGPAGLREYTTREVVRAELEVMGLDATRHLLSFYEPLLAELGVVRSCDLAKRRGGEMVIVAGVKVSSQTPAVRSGQRIIFLTLDDATGPVDVTVFERVQDRVARTIFHSHLLAIRGRLRRTGVRGASIIAEEVWDLAVLDEARRTGDLHLPVPRKLWHASGGSAGW